MSHRILSIDTARTNDGSKAVIFCLGGNLTSDLEPLLRFELDMTLVRERKGGTILDLSEVTGLSGAVIGRIASFAKHLQLDGILLAVILPKDEKVSKRLVPFASSFDHVAEDMTWAKALLNFKDDDGDSDPDEEEDEQQDTAT